MNEVRKKYWKEIYDLSDLTLKQQTIIEKKNECQ